MTLTLTAVFFLLHPTFHLFSLLFITCIVEIFCLLSSLNQYNKVNFTQVESYHDHKIILINICDLKAM